MHKANVSEKYAINFPKTPQKFRRMKLRSFGCLPMRWPPSRTEYSRKKINENSTLFSRIVNFFLIYFVNIIIQYNSFLIPLVCVLFLFLHWNSNISQKYSQKIFSYMLDILNPESCIVSSRDWLETKSNLNRCGPKRLLHLPWSQMHYRGVKSNIIWFEKFETKTF